MKTKKVGIYTCGSYDVELFIRAGGGGEFTTASDDSHIAAIILGIDEENWHEMLSVLLHEIGELTRTILFCRYDRNNYFGNDHASYVFFYNHTQFSDLCAREAIFLSKALPDLVEEWNKRKKEKRKKK